MPIWQLPDQPGVDHSQSITPTSVNVTANATIHTKGASWTQLTAAIPNGVTGLHVAATGVATAATVTLILLDLAIGAASSEVVVVSNLQCGGQGANTTTPGYFLPLRLPDGARLSARCQALIASDVVTLNVGFETGSMAPRYSAVDTYGPNTATSRGVLLSQNNTTWTEITASTTNPIDALLLLVDPYDDTTQTAALNGYDIGIGAAAAEVAAYRTYRRWTASENYTQHLVSDSVPIPTGGIPTGTRISIRRTAAYSNNEGAQLYGFRK